MIPVNYSEGNFLLAETETTVQLYDAVVSKKTTTNLKPKDMPDKEYQKILTSLNMATNLEFRVPALDEWQYAYIGGEKSQSYTYSGSNNIDEVAWYELNSKIQNGRNVKQKKPNELGFYDMSGNFTELVVEEDGTLAYYGGCGYSRASSCLVNSKGKSLLGDGLRLALSVNHKAQAE